MVIFLVIPVKMFFLYFSQPVFFFGLENVHVEMQSASGEVLPNACICLANIKVSPARSVQLQKDVKMHGACIDLTEAGQL